MNMSAPLLLDAYDAARLAPAAVYEMRESADTYAAAIAGTLLTLEEVALLAFGVPEPSGAISHTFPPLALCMFEARGIWRDRYALKAPIADALARRAATAAIGETNATP